LGLLVWGQGQGYWVGITGLGSGSGSGLLGWGYLVGVPGSGSGSGWGLLGWGQGQGYWVGVTWLGFLGQGKGGGYWVGVTGLGSGYIDECYQRGQGSQRGQWSFSKLRKFIKNRKICQKCPRTLAFGVSGVCGTAQVTGFFISRTAAKLRGGYTPPMGDSHVKKLVEFGKKLSVPRVDSQNRHSQGSENTLLIGFGGLRIHTSNGFFHILHSLATRGHAFGKMVEMS